MSSVSHPWLVLKFGGTSVSTATNWRNIAGILRSRLNQGFRPVVVHSALSGVTNRLESLLAAQTEPERQALLAAILRQHQELAAALDLEDRSDWQSHCCAAVP
jgi:bifunctional diaminopimelate decarboxylase / aspartate kinase